MRDWRPRLAIPLLQVFDSKQRMKATAGHGLDQKLASYQKSMLCVIIQSRDRRDVAEPLSHLCAAMVVVSFERLRLVLDNESHTRCMRNCIFGIAICTY